MLRTSLRIYPRVGTWWANRGPDAVPPIRDRPLATSAQARQPRDHRGGHALKVVLLRLLMATGLVLGALAEQPTPADTGSSTTRSVATGYSLPAHHGTPPALNISSSGAHAHSPCAALADEAARSALVRSAIRHAWGHRPSQQHVPVADDDMILVCDSYDPPAGCTAALVAVESSYPEGADDYMGRSPWKPLPHPPILALAPSCEALHQPLWGEEWRAAIAARHNHTSAGDRPSTSRPRPGSRDPKVAGGDAYLIRGSGGGWAATLAWAVRLATLAALYAASLVGGVQRLAKRPRALVMCALYLLVPPVEAYPTATATEAVTDSVWLQAGLAAALLSVAAWLMLSRDDWAAGARQIMEPPTAEEREEALEAAYLQSPEPSHTALTVLGNWLGMTADAVGGWFEQRRRRCSAATASTDSSRMVGSREPDASLGLGGLAAEVPSTCSAAHLPSFDFDSAIAGLSAESGDHDENSGFRVLIPPVAAGRGVQPAPPGPRSGRASGERRKAGGPSEGLPGNTRALPNGWSRVEVPPKKPGAKHRDFARYVYIGPGGLKAYSVGDAWTKHEKPKAGEPADGPRFGTFQRGPASAFKLGPTITLGSTPPHQQAWLGQRRYAPPAEVRRGGAQPQPHVRRPAPGDVRGASASGTSSGAAATAAPAMVHSEAPPRPVTDTLLAGKRPRAGETSAATNGKAPARFAGRASGQEPTLPSAPSSAPRAEADAAASGKAPVRLGGRPLGQEPTQPPPLSAPPSPPSPHAAARRQDGSRSPPRSRYTLPGLGRRLRAAVLGMAVVPVAPALFQPHCSIGAVGRPVSNATAVAPLAQLSGYWPLGEESEGVAIVVAPLIAMRARKEGGLDEAPPPLMVLPHHHLACVPSFPQPGALVCPCTVQPSSHCEANAGALTREANVEGVPEGTVADSEGERGNPSCIGCDALTSGALTLMAIAIAIRRSRHRSWGSVRGWKCTWTRRLDRRWVAIVLWSALHVRSALAATSDDGARLNEAIAAAGGAVALLQALVGRLGLDAAIAGLGGAAMLVPALVGSLGMRGVRALLRQADATGERPSLSTAGPPGDAAAEPTGASLPPGLGVERATATPVPSATDPEARQRRELCAHSAETRVGPSHSRKARNQKQTDREAAYWEERERQRAAGRLFGTATCRTWIVLAFVSQLQKRTKKHAEELERCRMVQERPARVACARIIAAIRARIARRAALLRMLGTAPRPLYGFDVGCDERSGAMVFRNRSGTISPHHPALAWRPGNAEIIPAYAPDGTVVAPLSPPRDSPIVLCPEQGGRWCYYNTELGTASWHAPEGSTPLALRTLRAVELPLHAPPKLPAGVKLNALGETDWVPLFQDAINCVRLMHNHTGIVRDAPWVALRDPGGCPYFANLVTRVTRWLPPHRWMEGFVCRRPVTSSYEFELGYPFPPSDRAMLCRFDSRTPLMGAYGRQTVMGGAPYFHEGGVPQYPPDAYDTPDTYPLADYVGVAVGAGLVHWVRSDDMVGVAAAASGNGGNRTPSVPTTPEPVGYLGGRCTPSSSGGASYVSVRSSQPEGKELSMQTTAGPAPDVPRRELQPDPTPEMARRTPTIIEAPAYHRAAGVVQRAWRWYVLSESDPSDAPATYEMAEATCPTAGPHRFLLRDGWQPVVAAAWALGRGDTGEAVRAGRLLAVAANSWLWHERLHAQDAASRDVRRRRLICHREAIGLAVAQLRSARAFGVVRLGLDAT